MIDLGRARVAQVAVILVVVMAIALSAATITTLEGDELGLGEDSRISNPDRGGSVDTFNVSGGEEAENATGEAPVIVAQICIGFLRSPLGIFGVVGGVALLLGAAYWRYNVASTILFGTALIPPVIAVYFFLTNCSSGEEQSGGLFAGTTNPVAQGGGGGLGELPIAPEFIAVAVLGLIGVAAFAFVKSTRGDELVEPELEDEEPDIDPEAFARAAGRAADRIQKAHASVDNAVYRAWLEMTQLLAMPKPETSTPRDFAEAAVEAGLAEEDVEELTELFVEVRYGGQSADTREDRAIEILRNIEETYSEGRKRTDAEQADN